MKANKTTSTEKGAEKVPTGLQLDIVSNNALANGSDADSGQATVTGNDGAIADGTAVKFKLPKESKSTVFVEKGPHILSYSPQTLLVGTSGGTASASFTDNDSSGGTVTLTASLLNYPDVTPQSKDFQFKPFSQSDCKLTWGETLNNARANWKFPNQGQVVATDNGKTVPDGTKITFELSDGSAIFDLSDPNICDHGDNWITVKTQTQDGKSVAAASFTDTDAETVTLQARFTENSAIAAAPKQFKFVDSNVFYLRADNGCYAAVNGFDVMGAVWPEVNEHCKFTLEPHGNDEIALIGNNNYYVRQGRAKGVLVDTLVVDSDSPNNFIIEYKSPFLILLKYKDNGKYVTIVTVGPFPALSAESSKPDETCQLTVSWPDAKS